MNEDNLRTLVILHRIYGGLQLILACCAMLYLTLLLGLFGLAAASEPNKAPPAIVGGIFAVIWGFALVLIVGFACLNFVAANWIRDRRNWTGLIVISGINCLHIPHGTGLGVFTIVVLNRPDVRQSFT
jgi:hypothetical protein